MRIAHRDDPELDGSRSDLKTIALGLLRGLERHGRRPEVRNAEVDGDDAVLADACLHRTGGAPELEVERVAWVSLTWSAR